MRIFWAAERFTGFGSDPFAPGRDAGETTTVTGRRKADLRTAVKAACPPVPGVYGMVDAAGRLIYVGKSKRLRARLLSYFSPRVAREKPGHILGETATILWERQPSEFAALLRELYLIRTWRPRWNVKDQPKSRQPSYVCLGRPPAPHLFLANEPPKGAVAYGPFHGRRGIAEAVAALNQHFRLRDCAGTTPFHFSDQQELFPEPRRPGCLRLDIATCLGPCAGGCTRADYAAAVKQAKAFLDGRDDGPLVALGDAMTRAAVARRFERAAALRDTLAAVESFARRLERLRTARKTFNFVYPVETQEGRELWYLVARGCVAAAVHSPADRRRVGPARRLLEQWQAAGRLDGFPVAVQHPTIGFLSRWFRTRPDELARTIDVETALAVCRGEVPALPR